MESQKESGYAFIQFKLSKSWSLSCCEMCTSCDDVDLCGEQLKTTKYEEVMLLWFPSSIPIKYEDEADCKD